LYKKTTSTYSNNSWFGITEEVSPKFPTSSVKVAETFLLRRSEGCRRESDAEKKVLFI
jgi:hypothetical protein